MARQSDLYLHGIGLQLQRIRPVSGTSVSCADRVPLHDHVVPASLQALGVGLPDLGPALRQAGRLLPIHGYRPGISVDADRLSGGTHPFRQHPQHGAGAASHIRYPGARHDARGRPLRGLVVGGDCRHHAVAQQLLLTQRQAVAGSPGAAAPMTATYPLRSPARTRKTAARALRSRSF